VRQVLLDFKCFAAGPLSYKSSVLPMLIQSVDPLSAVILVVGASDNPMDSLSLNVLSTNTVNLRLKANALYVPPRADLVTSTCCIFAHLFSWDFFLGDPG
jgi:hypothetical protein